jgi:NADPH:quinone reductase
MRVAYDEKNGPAAEVLKRGEMETPKPGPGEVRVRVRASGINPSDVKNRAGLTRKIAFPRVIPNSDGAGEIDMVGEGVSPKRVGERVWTYWAAWKRPFGTSAEYVVLPEHLAPRLPENVSFDEGAALGIPAMTGYRAVEIADAQKGMTVLVSGGAGAVAQYAIQFAKARGAMVIATISSDEKAKVARDCGADHTVNYKTENVGERVTQVTDRKGVDTIIELDLTANAKLIPAVLRPRGQVVIYGTMPEAAIPAAFCLVNTIRLQFFLVYELNQEERERAVAGINRMLEENRLLNRVDRSFTLDQIVAAHEAMESGKAIGKIVLRPG